MYYSKYKFLSDVIHDPINNQYTQVISQQQCQHIHNINDDYDDVLTLIEAVAQYWDKYLKTTAGYEYYNEYTKQYTQPSIFDSINPELFTRVDSIRNIPLGV